LIKPGSVYADQLGVHYYDIEKDQYRNIRSWRVDNDALSDISNTDLELSRESTRLDKIRDDLLKEYNRYITSNAEDYDTEDVRSKRKEYREKIIDATNAAKRALAEYREFGATKKRNDYVNKQLEKLGYKPDELDSSTHNHSWELKIKGNHEILPAEHREKGRLLVIIPKRDMNIFDISTGESDLLNPQYHKLDLFDALQKKGYDGVKIDDYAQTEQYGNVGHASIGFFKSALSNMDIKEITDVVHPRDINKKESDEYSKWKAMNESVLHDKFISFVNLFKNYDPILVESSVNGFEFIVNHLLILAMTTHQI
jgi:hypothetical protein